MKFFTITLLLFYGFQCHSQNIAGSYELVVDAKNAYFKYDLDLKSDGIFLFKYYADHYHSVGEPYTKYAKGRWQLDKKVVSFTAIESDINEQFTLDFNNTKARFITKSLRDKSKRAIPTSIRIYDSEIPWIINRTLIKN